MILRPTVAALLLTGAAPRLAAQAAAIPPAERQIAWAVQAAPERMQADATVLGYRGGAMVTLRRGSGSLVCLADNPAEPAHHVSCYHKDLDPFMSRGRELQARGLARPAIDSVRRAEIASGRIRLPEAPAVLYQLFAPAGNADAATGVVRNTKAMTVVYIPYATAETTGLSLRPGKGRPWLMDPGLPWAHIMITP